MDTVNRFLDFWFSNGAYLMPVFLSISLLGISLGMAGLTKDNVIRTAIIFPVALMFYALGFVAGPFGKEIFWNLSAEMLTGLAALIILFFYNMWESWANTLATIGLFAFILVLFFDKDAPQANLFVNLSTGLIGAFLIVALLRREWDFSPENRERMLTQHVREVRKEQAGMREQIGDYFLMVTGKDEAAVGQKIDFLTASNIQTFDPQPIASDATTGLHYQLMHGRIITVVKEEETVFLKNNEARIRLLAFPDAVKRVYAQIKEVLEATEMKQIEFSDKRMEHMEFIVNTPKVLFSDYLEKQLILLAREWRHGDEAHLQQATDALLAWAHEHQFIKE